jgi:hypothetical protein
MKDFEKFRQKYALVMGVIVSFVTPYLFDLFKSSISNNTLRHVVILISVGTALLLLNSLLENLINKNASFRKLIAKKVFIEGYWFDKTIENEDLLHVLLMNICYQEGAYVVTAEYFDKNQQSIGTFTSTPSTYNNNELLFRVDVSYLLSKSNDGIDYLKFNSPPTFYIGYYLDLHDPEGIKKYEVQGKRVSKDDLKKYHRLKEDTDKKNFVQKLINEMNLHRS